MSWVVGEIGLREKQSCASLSDRQPPKERTMADPTVALMDYLRNMVLEPDESFLQDALQWLTQTVVVPSPASSLPRSCYSSIHSSPGTSLESSLSDSS
jgi:hypothetical protein